MIKFDTVNRAWENHDGATNFHYTHKWLDTLIHRWIVSNKLHSTMTIIYMYIMIYTCIFAYLYIQCKASSYMEYNNKINHW